MLSFLALEPPYIFCGFLVGFIVGLTGVGGGSLMTPLLVTVFNVHPATAVGTDLLFAACTKTVGTAVHGFNKSVNWSVFSRLALGSVPAAAVTLILLNWSGVHDQRTASLITTILGIMLLATALSLFFRAQLMRFAHHKLALSDRGQFVATVITGAVLGTLVSVTSVGAGAIGVSVLMALYPRMPILRVVGTDIAHAVPLTFVAGLGHWAIGSVDFAMLASLLAGSIPGVLLASLLAPRSGETILRFALGGVLVLSGVKLLMA